MSILSITLAKLLKTRAPKINSIHLILWPFFFRCTDLRDHSIGYRGKAKSVTKLLHQVTILDF